MNRKTLQSLILALEAALIIVSLSPAPAPPWG